jgi:hypothetical protein
LSERAAQPTWWPVVRRSAGLGAFPLMLALVVGHVLLRERSWVHEWTWAFVQLAFVTVLLGPFVAGVAAWEGRRLAMASALVDSSVRRGRATAAALAAVALWATVALLAGALIVTALVRTAGTPGWPSPTTLACLAPPAGLLAAYAGVGLLVGRWTAHPLAAPATAVGSFLATLGLYVAGPTQLVDVGGATGSLVRLAPRPDLQLAQVCFFLFLVLLTTLLTTTPRPGSGAWRAAGDAVTLSGVGVGFTAALALLLAHGGESLRPVGEHLSCVGRSPRVCVAEGYVRYASTARRALLPYLDALRGAGVHVPSEFQQDAEPGLVSVGPVDSTLLLGADSAGSAVVAAFLSKRCALDEQPAVLASWEGLTAWLRAEVTGRRPSDPTLPAVVRGPRSAAQLAWVRHAVSELASCRG